MSMNRRSDIDIAKGFALFLVVLGHVVTMHHTIFRWIYAFHMPAFFFLSGMTFRPEKSILSGLHQKEGTDAHPPLFCDYPDRVSHLHHPALLSSGYQRIWVEAHSEMDFLLWAAPADLHRPAVVFAGTVFCRSLCTGLAAYL